MSSNYVDTVTGTKCKTNEAILWDVTATKCGIYIEKVPTPRFYFVKGLFTSTIEILLDDTN
jgi:hypothetical protein